MQLGGALQPPTPTLLSAAQKRCGAMNPPSANRGKCGLSPDPGEGTLHLKVGVLCLIGGLLKLQSCRG